MKIKAKTPCYKFRDVSPLAQIEKLKEELSEVEAAFKEYQQNSQNDEIFINLLVEILDVQACASTFIYQLMDDYDHGNRAAKRALKKAKKAVVAKNMCRGYYLKPKQIYWLTEKQ